MSAYFDDEDYNKGGSDDDSSVASSASSSNNEDIEDENENEVLEEDDNEVLDEDEDEDEDEEEEEEQDELDDEDEIKEEIKDEKEIQKSKRPKKIPTKTVYKKPLDEMSSDSEDDNDGENYLQKFDRDVNENYIANFHPECAIQNYDEIMTMITVIRDKDGIIVDDLHKTVPFLTKFEKARILGQRAKQINSGATPFIKVPENVIDGYLIAELELKEKKIPFIIRRPLPNGGSEYWSIKDLEDIVF